jgi:hypothetical protein
MASKKTSDSFKGSLAKLSTGAFSGAKRYGISQGFKQSAGMNFGLPSSPQALHPNLSSTGFDWSGLGKQLSSGNGISSLLGGGSGLASFGGIGSLISGISSLFGGGQKTLPALQLFQLPDAVNQTVHLNSASGSASTSPSIHVHVQALDSQSFVTKSNDIAKAVKSAMLNSHSLNDVVAEL